MALPKMRFFKSKKAASFNEARIARLLANVDELPVPLDDVAHLSTSHYPKGIAVGDFHGDRFDEDTFKALLAKARTGFNDLLIIAGDLANCTAFNPHKVDRKDVEDWSQEVENLALLMEVLGEHFKHILIIPGTHDFWINKSLHKGEMTFEQLARLYIPSYLLAEDRISTSEMTWCTLDVDKEAPVVIYHAGSYLKTPLAGAERAHWRCLEYYEKRCHILSFHGHETHIGLRGPDGNKRLWIEAGGMARRAKNLYPHYYLDDRYRMWTPSFVTWEAKKNAPLKLNVHHELNKE